MTVNIHKMHTKKINIIAIINLFSNGKKVFDLHMKTIITLPYIRKTAFLLNIYFSFYHNI